jgi:hypothetical protein
MHLYKVSSVQLCNLIKSHALVSVESGDGEFHYVITQDKINRIHEITNFEEWMQVYIIFDAFHHYGWITCHRPYPSDENRGEDSKGVLETEQ